MTFTEAKEDLRLLSGKNDLDIYYRILTFPSMTDPDDLTGGSFSDPPNEKYKEFFNKFKEIDITDPKEFKPIHLLAYFVRKYQSLYNVKYAFKFNTPSPVKCFEMFHIKRLGVILTSKPEILKDYIDWLFTNKVSQLKKRFSSISFITKEENVRDYKMQVLFAKKTSVGNGINRSAQLPDSYKTAFNKNGILANTYGDLAFLSQSFPMSDLVKQSFETIELLGFDKSILATIV